jgi:thiamine biosynthesis protein ThiS
MKMEIELNNTNTNLNTEELSISDLLVLKKFTFKLLIVKVNNAIIKKDEYSKTLIHDGDKVDVIHLISGG